jgi:hypothetical protein
MNQNINQKPVPRKFCTDEKGNRHYVCRKSDVGEKIPDGYVALASYKKQEGDDTSLRVFLHYVPEKDIRSNHLSTIIFFHDTTRRMILDPFYGHVSVRIRARRLYHLIRQSELEEKK